MINMLMMPYLAMYYRRFLKASHNPAIQFDMLKHIIQSNMHTQFGKAHDFSHIHSYKDYTSHIPINTYEYYSDYIKDICQSRSDILTKQDVTLMEPTSGTTSGTKLIPYTQCLQNEFKKGIYPWLYDLYSHNRNLLKGHAYWALSPATHSQYDCSIPVGFMKDSEYLGFIGKLIERNMTVPSTVSSIKDTEIWKKTTCAYLLSDSNLRFISVWNPQFLTVLLEYIGNNRDKLIEMIGHDKHFSVSSKRLKALKQICSYGEIDFEAIWPNLKMISCWADSFAAMALKPLKDLLPHIEIQPKGLIATEAFISFPLTGQGNVLSILSHFFEFMDKGGNIYTADNLQAGCEYTVIITTSGGLYRYNLGDRVKVMGFFNKLPLITFLGRDSTILDFFGEKLEESFIDSILKKYILDKYNTGFIAFLPRPGKAFSYAIHIGSNDNISIEALAELIDNALCENYHYKHAQSIGQIGRVQLFHSSSSAYTERYLNYMNQKGMKIGDIKPVMISPDNALSYILEE